MCLDQHKPSPWAGKPLGPKNPIRALTDIPRKGPRTGAAGGRTSVSAPMPIHPQTPAPTGSKRVGTDHAPAATAARAPSPANRLAPNRAPSPAGEGWGEGEAATFLCGLSCFSDLSLHSLWLHSLGLGPRGEGETAARFVRPADARWVWIAAEQRCAKPIPNLFSAQRDDGLPTHAQRSGHRGPPPRHPVSGPGRTVCSVERPADGG